MTDEYRAELIRRTRLVLEAGASPDHLGTFPWLTGALGDPESPVWFVAENPSLSMVERATAPGGGLPTEESQWYASRGDRLFRDMLVKHGFKVTPQDSPGGWRCYITNAIKEPDYAERWRGAPKARHDAAAERWQPVLDWELKQGQPRLVVALGQTVRRVLRSMSRRGLHLPRVETISHYSYIAFRPEGRLGPMAPERVERYDQDFGRIAELAQMGG